MTLRSASNLTLIIPRTHEQSVENVRFALVHQKSVTIYLQMFYPQIRFQLLKSDIKYYSYVLSLTNSTY
jgi:hypothetical protein